MLTLLPPTPALCGSDRMIEVVCNDRLGKKVRVKCKYPRAAERRWPGAGEGVRAAGGGAR